MSTSMKDQRGDSARRTKGMGLTLDATHAVPVINFGRNLRKSTSKFLLLFTRRKLSFVRRETNANSIRSNPIARTEF